MAWNTADQPFTYHPPVAPETPVADNTGAKLISAGSGAGIEMFTRMALARQQAELAREKDLSDADLEAQKLGLAKQQLAQDYELKKQYYGILGSEIVNRQDKASASMDKGIAKMAAKNAATQNYFDTIAENDTRASQAAVDLKLSDETFRNDHPVKWMANLDEFQRRFGTAKVGDVPQMLSGFKAQADTMKVPFLEGAQYQMDTTDSSKSSWAAPKGMKTIMAPLDQVVARFRDPNQRINTVNSLVAAGAGHVVDDLKDVHAPKFKVSVDNQNVGNVLRDAGTDVQFGRGKPEVPTILRNSKPTAGMIYSNAANDPNLVVPAPISTSSSDVPDTGSLRDQSNQINNGATLPAPNLPALAPGSSIESPSGIGAPTSSATPAFQPTQTDIHLQHARNALQAGAPQDLIAQRLASLGIDPNMLVA